MTVTERFTLEQFIVISQRFCFGKMQPLDPDSARLLNENLWELYGNEPSAVPIDPESALYRRLMK